MQPGSSTKLLFIDVGLGPQITLLFFFYFLYVTAEKMISLQCLIQVTHADTHFDGMWRWGLW